MTIEEEGCCLDEMGGRVYGNEEWAQFLGSKGRKGKMFLKVYLSTRFEALGEECFNETNQDRCADLIEEIKAIKKVLSEDSNKQETSTQKNGS